MAKVTCPNPECRTVSPIPDALVGRKVRCKVCNTIFVTAVAEAPAAAGASVTRADGADGLTMTGRRAATLNRSRGGAAGAAGRSAPAKSGGRGVWLVVAAVLLLPALVVGGFFAFKVFGSRGQAAAPGGAGPATTGGAAPVAHGADKARQVYGGIEIGSSGIKATVVELFPDEALGYDYRFLEKNKSFDTQLMDKTGRLDPDALRDSVKAVKRFFGEMTRDYDVPPERIFIVGSSSLFPEEDSKDQAKAERVRKDKASLADPVKEATGKQMDFNTVDEEVEQLITCLVPKKHEDESLLINVGTGSTRGGYRDPSGAFVTFTAPGIRIFEGLIKRQADNKPAQLPEAARRLAEKELHEPLREELKKKERYPDLTRRRRVYLNGGIVWVMATLLHPEQRDQQVRLKAQDIDDFRELVGLHPDRDFPEFQVPAGLSAEAKENVASVQTKFKTPKLIAGAEVLKALSDEMALSGKDLYYTRDGDVGWLLAYIGEAYTREKGAAKK